jgi:phage-related protein
VEEIGVEFSIYSDQAEKNAKKLSESMFTLDTNTDKASTAFKAINNALTNMVPSQETATSTIEQGNQIISQASMSAFEYAKGILYANMAMGLYNKAMSAIPEISKTFNDIGDVISQSFFAPLKDEVIPILNEIMAFVQENKVVFTIFGNVVANVFRTIVQVVKQVFEMVGNIINNVFGTASGSIKDTAKGIADFLNFIVLKIAFVMTFLLVLMEPILETIAEGIKWTFQNVALPILSQFGDMISYIAQLFIDPLQAIESFDTLTQSLAAGGLTLLVGGVVLLGKAILASLVPAIISATSATIAFTIALLANPMTWIVIGVMALVASFVLLYKHWDTIKKAFVDGINTIVNYIKNIYESFSFIIDVMLPIIPVIKLIINNWDELVNGFNTGIEYITSLWDKLMGTIFGALDKLKEVGSIIGSIFGGGDKNINVNSTAQEMDSSGRPKTIGGNIEAKGDIESLKTPTSVRQENNIENKTTFNITGDSPEEIARLVDTKMKQKDNSPKKQFNKFAPAQGLL